MTANKLVTLTRAGFAAVTLLFTLYSMDTKAQHNNHPDNGKMAARLIRYEVKPGQLDAFRKAIGDYILYSLSIESNIVSEAYYEQDKPTVLWIIERWSSKAALEKLNGSIQVKTIQSLSGNGLMQPAKIIYVRDLEPLTKQQWRTVEKKEDKPVTVMLFVDSKAGTEKHFMEVYHTAMPQFRSEPGVINYQLSQLEDDSIQFVTYEKFRNEEAFQDHLNFPPIKPVIDYLNTSIKKQPFQTGLHKLIAFTSLSTEKR